MWVMLKQLHWIIRYWQFREQLGDFAITMRILLWILVYFLIFFINFGPLRWAVGAPWSCAWCHYNTAVPFSAVCTLNSKTHPQYLTPLSSACWLFIQSWTFCHNNNGTLARQSLDSGSPNVLQITCERKTKQHPTSRTASFEEKKVDKMFNSLQVKPKIPTCCTAHCCICCCFPSSMAFDLFSLILSNLSRITRPSSCFRGTSKSVHEISWMENRL